MVKVDSAHFATLMERVRTGDEVAASELVKHYEPEIRRDIRLRLTNPKLRRIVDSMDISQSVFGNFFVRATLGEFELERPEQLLKLLSKMVTNKVIDRHRRESSRKLQDTIDDPIENRDISDGAPTASEIVSGAELVSRFKERLSNEELEIANLRRNGVSWSDISQQLGQNDDELRKRLSRACQRVMTELGL